MAVSYLASLKDELSLDVTWVIQILNTTWAHLEIFGGLFEDLALLIATLVCNVPQLTPTTPSCTHAIRYKSPNFTHTTHTLYPVQVAQLPLSLSDGRWHHICITWTTRDGFWEAYQDGERLGTGDNLAPWHPIKPGGVIILGQEQVRAMKKLRQYRASVCAFAPVCILP